MTHTPTAERSVDPRSVVQHLTPQDAEHVHRMLVRKALAEFSHERLLRPHACSPGTYEIASDDARVTYRFRARVLELDHWQIDPASIERTVDGRPAGLDALELVTELRGTLGISDAMLPAYLEEISSTLYGAAYKLTRKPLPAKELVLADFQTIESSMTEGHPCFVANNGRIGFDAVDYRSYAPETGATFQIVWLAVLKQKATFSCGAGLTGSELLRQELDAADRGTFGARLRERSLDPADYLLMPVHPWQWFNKLSITFASDIARQDIVCLGVGDDRYQAQQSIRTFFNASSPHKAYVKTSLSILNMGFMRGLSPAYMQATPAINDWVAELVAQDGVLQRTGFGVLREIAAVGYHNHHYEALAQDTPYKKMLSALWRESPLAQLRPGQRLATMASLLHTDAEGGAFASELIRASGLGAPEWVRRYLEAYLTPLLHCFYEYELVFMPHGENLIMVLEDHVPVRMIMKDIGEEIAVLDPDRPLPIEIERVRAAVPEGLKLLSIFTDVFDCIFRFLGAILEEEGLLTADEFWSAVADCVTRYQDERPELAEKFALHDLFAPDFELSCLNRLQLRNHQQMVDLSDPAGNLAMAGTLSNPIARFAPR